jgi:hypothetical protein
MMKKREQFVKGKFRSCWVCGLPTRYVETTYETALHKRRCLPIADRAYWKVMSDSGAPDLRGFANWRLYRFMKRGCKYRGEPTRPRPMDDPGFYPHHSVKG